MGCPAPARPEALRPVNRPIWAMVRSAGVSGVKTRYHRFESQFDCLRNRRTRPARCLSLFQSQISCSGGKPVSLNSKLFWYNEISKDMEEYWPDLDRSGQICRDPARFRPPVATQNCQICIWNWQDLIRPIRNSTRVGCGLWFLPPESFRSSRVGHKPDPGRPVDTPSVMA